MVCINPQLFILNITQFETHILFGRCEVNKPNSLFMSSLVFSKYYIILFFFPLKMCVWVEYKQVSREASLPSPSRHQIQVAAIGRIESRCRFLVSGRSDSGRSNISRSLLYINQIQVGAKGRIYIWYVCIFLKMQFRQLASSNLSRSTIGLLQANYQYIFRQVFY